MDSIEDINAKRDARRRRILENSGKRLSRITGRNTSIISEAYPMQPDVLKQTFISRNPQNETSHHDMNGKMLGNDNTSTQQNYTSHILIINRTSYVLLAVIVNILLALQLDHFFGKTITVPYFPIMLGRLYSYKTVQEEQDNSLLYPALILCNIKPELTYQLKKLATIFHIIFGDLALYIFSFTLVHYGVFLLSA